MIIRNLNFAGFKFEDNVSGLDLSKIENQKILSTRGENKKFLLESILGIIYGFNDQEKIEYKDPRANVFTGRIELQFESYTLHIDRDFETDIVAILSSSENEQKSVFQGRDRYTESEDRPYNEVLETVFTFTEKPFLLERCKTKIETVSSTFGDVLDTLYLFLRPKFKIAAMEKLINSCNRIMENNTIVAPLDEALLADSLQKSINRLHLLRNAKKVVQGKESLDSDIKQFEFYWDELIKSSASDNSLSSFKERFPNIYKLDPKIVRRDVNHYLELKKNLDQSWNNLEVLLSQKTEHEKLMSSKLIVYEKVPDSFIDDFHVYQNLSIDLAQLKNDKDKHDILLGNYYSDLQRFRTKEVFTHLFSLSSIIGVCYLLFPDKLIFGIAGAILASISFGLVFSKFKKSKKSSINNTLKTYSTLKKKITKIENNITELRQDSYLLDDLGYVDTHIELFKKYKSSKNILKKIEEEKKRLEKELKSEKYTTTLPELKREYKNIINSDDKDRIKENLAQFLEQQQIENSLNHLHRKTRKIEPLSKIITEYKKIVKMLAHTKEQIDIFLSVDDFEKDIDNQITYLERAINHLQQKINQDSTSL